MALHRIIGREGGYPGIREIRDRILQSFPPRDGGRNSLQVLETGFAWYRPLKFRKVDEDGARQALLRRRPVLARFHLFSTGWLKFGEHCRTKEHAPLSRADMAEHQSAPSDGGHAVVLTDCNPASLTFLNSWGEFWGKNGSFSVENHTVLQTDGIPASFYDVFWLESGLLPTERRKYSTYQE